VSPDTLAFLAVRLILDAPWRFLWSTDVRCGFVPFHLVAARVRGNRSALSLVGVAVSHVATRHSGVASGAVLTGRTGWGFGACSLIS